MDIKEQEAHKHLQDLFNKYQLKYGYLTGQDNFRFGHGVYQNDEYSNLTYEITINRTHAKTGDVIFYVSSDVMYRGSKAGIFANTYSYTLKIGRHGETKRHDFYSEEKLLSELDRIFKAEYKRVMRMNQQKLVKQINSLPS
jgi:hypothetical protein